MSEATQRCYHCGSPLGETACSVVLPQGPVPACCPGCEAAITMIHQAGLAAYYQYRTALPDRIEPQQATAQATDEAGLLESVCLPQDHGRLQVTLAVGNLVCGACVWLLEHRLAQCHGVVEAHVHAASSCALVVFDPRHIGLNQLCATFAALGYPATPMVPGSFEPPAELNRPLLLRLGIAGMAAMQVMMFAAASYVTGPQGLPVLYRNLFNGTSLLFATVVLLFSATPFLAGAWRDLRMRRVGMDVPVSMGLLGAYAISLAHTLTGHGVVYFDSVTMVTFFLLTSRYLGAAARTRAMSQLQDILGEKTTLARRLDAGQERIVRPGELAVGDTLVLHPGETLAADGQILAGNALVSEAVLTGEDAPRRCGPGDTLLAGARLIEGALHIRLATTARTARRALIGQRAAEALLQRTVRHALPERIAGWFAAGTLLLAALAWVIWHGDGQAWSVVLAVLVGSCPCAFALAAPTVELAATGRLMAMGVLLLRPRALAALAQARTIVFDKTGTCTEPVMRLVKVHLLRPELDHDRACHLAAALQRHGEHPIARALRWADGTQYHQVSPADSVTITHVPGEGVGGVIEGRMLRLGKADFAMQGKDWPQSATMLAGVPHDQAITRIHLADERGLLAAFDLQSPLRPEAKDVMQRLLAMGCRLHLLSGDGHDPVSCVAHQLGIAGFQAQATPEAKVAALHQLQQDGSGAVIMVGDGVNDAQVLATADCGIAVGDGCDLAKTHADMVLLHHGLTNLPAILALARTVHSRILQNTWWSLAYNLAVVPLALGGWLTPIWAALGMSLSSLLVVGNARRLPQPDRRRKPSPVQPTTPAMTASL